MGRTTKLPARTLMAVAGVPALLGAQAAPAYATGDAHEAQSRLKAQSTVHFSMDEMNNSGAQAEATVTINPSGSVRVTLHGTGFTPNAPHAQHLHGSPSGNFFCPPPSADKNGDGQVATEEGLAMYGNIMVSLTTRGDVSADSGLAVDRMPVADGNGNLDYERTIPAGMIPRGITDNIDNLHIVQHGLDVNGNGKYDLPALGESVFAKSLGVKGVPEEATNPATCGEVSPAGAVETGGTGTTGIEGQPLFAAGGAALMGATVLLLTRRRLSAARVRG